METLLIVLCAVVFLLAVLVFSPVVVAIDSRNRQVRIRWLFVMEFQMPLPWTPGRKSLTLFRQSIPLRDRRAATKPVGVKEEPAEPAAGKPRPRKKRRAMRRLIVRCLGDSTIRRALAQQLAKFLRRVSQSVRMSRSASDVSLPDPAINGMLAGALAASSCGQRSGIRVNFTGENSLFLELRFHPHRVFKAFLMFLPGLPYRAMIKQWRAFSAARPR